MKLLAINCGSSSVKYALFEMTTEAVLASGLADRVGVGNGESAELRHDPADRSRVVIAKPMPDHNAAIALIMEVLTDPEHGALGSVAEIEAVGHRVVHGGTDYASSVLITDEVLRVIEKCAELSPLHNPPNIAGIRACTALLPDVPQVAVFDTAFAQTMPPCAYHYAIPYELFEKYAIRRYGFHGTSHRYVSGVVAGLLAERGVPMQAQRIVTAHLGNGASMTAVLGGKCIDTSMGFTPLEGLVMGTRSGDLDPAVVWFLMEREGLDTNQVDELLNKKSGVLGLSGVSSDMRDLLAAEAEGNSRARVALEVYTYRVRKYIGAYTAALSGLDAVAFTAGVGENSPVLRRRCLAGLEVLGLWLDEAANDKVIGPAGPCDISRTDSPARIYVVPTDEELMIARETHHLVATSR